MSELKEASRRVEEAARAAGLDVAVRQMTASTRTAEQAAKAAGCGVGQIVKSLVFRGKSSGTPYLLLVSGANRVNEKGVAAALGEALVRPDAQYVRDVTGFAIGGIPPLGHAMALTTYIDEALLAYDIVWAAAGTPESIFSVAPRALVTATGAKPLQVTLRQRQAATQWLQSDLPRRHYGRQPHLAYMTGGPERSRASEKRGITWASGMAARY